MLAALEQRGASFFADLARNTGRLASEVEDALWELVAAGLVTADGFENLRALIDPKRGAARAAAGRVPARRGPLGAACARRERPHELRRTLRAAVAAALGRGLPRSRGARDAGAAWRDLLVVLRRMEARGEIRGGRFAAAFVGEQFALPEALDLLRAVRRTGEATSSGTRSAAGGR